MPDWLSTITNPLKKKEPNDYDDRPAGEKHLELATDSLRQLIEDKKIPNRVRDMLKDDYEQVTAMLDKLENRHIHIAVFGRVSVGKSSLLNALLDKTVFSTSVLHGETTTVNMNQWEEYSDNGIFLIDTPGINEVDGEDRERMAHEVAERADLLLFVVDSDLTEVELSALNQVSRLHRPTILVVNKADRFSEDEQRQLRSILRKHTKDLLPPENIVFTIAETRTQTVIMVDDDGNETEHVRQRPNDIRALKTRLWDLIESEGKTLSALNASLFASNLSNNVAERILLVKREMGTKTIHMYCVGKSLSVAVNPIPIADIFAAAAIDAGMVMHLSKLYGLPMTKSEAGELLTTILAQLTALIGVTWAVNVLSSALKLGTGGVSTVLTASAQGAIAWYSTLVVGKVAERWLANGKSWGDAGPKLAVQQILDSLDRDSVMKEAREEIATYLRNKLKA